MKLYTMIIFLNEGYSSIKMMF